MSLALKILCVITIIVTAVGVDEVSAASASKKRKAKITKVKKTNKRHNVVKEDNRVIAAVSENVGVEVINPNEQFGCNEVLTSAAHMPSFPGGDAGLIDFLRKNIRYPQAAADNNIEGKVVVQFVVTKTGRVGDVKVVRSVDPDLDCEAVRVCKALPAFTPGRNAEGKPVNVWYTLPVQFKLDRLDVEQILKDTKDE